MAGIAEDRIIERGPWGTVEYAVRKDGSMPAKKGLEDLKKKDSRRYAQLVVLFRQYAQTGRLPETKFDRYIGTKLFKFKHKRAYPCRVPCFVMGNRCILTHLFRKRESSAWVNEQIKVAEHIMEEHTEREQKEKGLGI